MTWVFAVRAGTLSRNGSVVATGIYSGHGQGLNNPDMEAVQGVGPIPAGRWQIGTFMDNPHLGPVISHLTPKGFDPHGRSAFFLHGDNAELNHSASDGCIIAPRTIREMVEDSGDRDLIVTA